MGFFSKPTYISVGTSTSNLNNDNNTQYITEIVGNSLLSSESIPEILLQSHLNGLGVKIRQYFNYANTGKFYYGLPRVSIQKHLNNSNELVPVIKEETGAISVTLSMSKLAVLDLSYIAIPELVDNYGYNKFDNTFSFPDGFNNFRFDRPFNYLSYDLNNTKTNNISDGILVRSWNNRNQIIQSTVIYPKIDKTLIFNNYPQNGKVHHAIYDKVIQKTIKVETEVETENGTEIILTDKVVEEITYQNYFVYSTNKNKYPNLTDNTSNKPTITVYPIVPLRLNKVDLIAERYRNDKPYKTSKKILKILNVDIDYLAEKINESPDLDKIENAWFIAGIPLNTKSNKGKIYIQTFFSYMAEISVSGSTSFNTWLNKYGKKTSYGYYTENYNVPCNQFSISHSNYYVTFAFNYCNKSIRTGNVGKVGQVNITVGTKSILRYTGSYTVGNDRSMKQTRQSTYYTNYDTDITPITFTRQLTKNTYEITIVKGLTLINEIYGPSRTAEFIGSSVLNDPNEHGFIIPFIDQIKNRISLVDLSQAAMDGMNITFNSVVKQKGKWYQSNFFRVVSVILGIVGIVLAAISLGSSTYLTAAAWSSLSVASTTFFALLIDITIRLAIYYGTKIAMKIIVDKFGLDVAYIISLIIGAFAIGSSVDGLITGNVWANADFVTMGLTSATASLNNITSKLTNDVIKNYNDWYTDFQNKNEELEEAWKKMYPNIRINLGTLQKMEMTASTETLDEFLARTINPNPNDAILGVISNYVDTLLDLDNIRI